MSTTALCADTRSVAPPAISRKTWCPRRFWSPGAGSTTCPTTPSRGCTASRAGCWPTSAARPIAAPPWSGSSPAAANLAVASDPGERAGEGEVLRTALARLSERDREALMLVAWHELSGARAARAAGCTRAAFAVRLHRARGRLAAQLDLLEIAGRSGGQLEVAGGALMRGHDELMERLAAADPVRDREPLTPEAQREADAMLARLLATPVDRRPSRGGRTPGCDPECWRWPARPASRWRSSSRSTCSAPRRPAPPWSTARWRPCRGAASTTSSRP